MFRNYLDSTVYNKKHRLCLNATWKNESTNITHGSYPIDFFPHTNGTIYFTTFSVDVSKQFNPIFKNNFIEIQHGSYWPLSIFVTKKDDIYVALSGCNHSVHQIKNGSLFNSTQQVSFKGPCYGLFVDIEDSVYCSIPDHHQVFKGNLSELGPNNSVSVAGNGTRGNQSNTLDTPYGIFVHSNFSLYVADCGNNRIQRFNRSDTNGTTVEVCVTSSSKELFCPTGVILDRDDHLYILDYAVRVGRIGSTGYECLLNCNESPEKNFHQYPTNQRLSFHRNGHILITKPENQTIEQYDLIHDGCCKYFIHLLKHLQKL